MSSIFALILAFLSPSHSLVSLDLFSLSEQLLKSPKGKYTFQGTWMGHTIMKACDNL